jgi:hypothetical protein
MATSATELPGGEFHTAHNFLFSPHIAIAPVTSSLLDFSAQTHANIPYSTASIDDVLNGEDVNIPEDAWKAELNTRIEQITNLKRSSTEGRTESLNAYAHILMARYAREEVESHVGELVSSMIKSIRQETTEAETVKALKGTISAMKRVDFH